MARPKALGMGMDALFTENGTEGQQAQNLRLTEIFPNKTQPRRDFDDSATEALADSIKRHGVLQPILVRPLKSGGYQIVAGERRWRASRLAGLDEIPVYIRELDDAEAAQVESSGATQDEVAKAVGKSRSAVANSLRLLNLDPKTAELVKKGEISSGHARALLSVESPERRAEIVKLIIKNGISVRETEELAKKAPEPKKPAPKKRVSIYHEVELSLKETAGRVCKVTENKKGGGRLTVEFYDQGDLTALANAIAEINNNQVK